MLTLLRTGILVLVTLASCSAAHAVEDAQSGDVWINAGSVSYHPDRKSRFNEVNLGLGIEYKLDSRRAIVGGFYRNSVRLQSRYAGMAYTPVQFSAVRLGAVAGFADGYPEMREGRFSPLLAPVMTIEGKRFGVNFMFILPVASNVDAAVAVQLKVRLGT